MEQDYSFTGAEGFKGMTVAETLGELKETISLEDSQRLRGFLEYVGKSGAVGWIYDISAKAPIKLTMFLDGKAISTSICDIPRQDVHAISGRLDTGFRFTIPPSYFDDQEHILYFVDAFENRVLLRELAQGGAEKREWEILLPAEESRGHLDGFSDGRFKGWAVVTDNKTGLTRPATEIIAISDNNIIARSPPNLARADVASVMACPEKCGFAIYIEKTALIGVRTLHFYIDPGRRELIGSPIEIGADASPVDPSSLFLQANQDDGLTDDQISASDDVAQHVDLTRFSKRGLFAKAKALCAAVRAQTDNEHLNSYDSGRYDDDAAQIVARHLDRGFYLSSYPDIKEGGVDPVIHYTYSGWLESRDPTDWFDTSFYLSSNQDVKASGINPFVHYLNVGKFEGRATHDVNGYIRETIHTLTRPEDRTRGFVKPHLVCQLLQSALTRRLEQACAGRRGFALSVSHDCYVHNTGGIQIFLADEQSQLSSQGLAYFHIAPVIPNLVILTSESEPVLLHLVVDGEYAGITNYGDLEAALCSISLDSQQRRLFILNSFLGHTIGGLFRVYHAMRSSCNYFWLHDYSSMCAGFTLLRNNIEFCGAPSADSLTCRVCIYGESRKRHLLAVEILFQEISFDVVAPSRSALEVWTGGSKLPHRSSQVVEHCYIEHHSERVSIDTESQRGAPENPVRLAFIGFPEAHKGWHIFRELVSRINKMGVYKLFHFCSDVGAPTIYGVEKVSVRTSPFTRNAMVEALQKHEIDLTLVLSTWPETFSYVTYEALAAGCDVVAMSTSGNVADRILRDGRGIVALKREAMFGFFENLVAVAYVRCCHETPMHTGTLTPQGTTGSIEKALMCVA